MNQDQYHRIKYLLESGRPVVPLLGAGISFASGIPTIPLIVNYLLKIDGYFDEDAFQPIWDSKPGAVRLTKEGHLELFGYPDPYQLNAELWQAADLRPDELRNPITDLGRQYLTQLVERRKHELMQRGIEDDWRKVLEAVTSRDFRPRSRKVSERLLRILQDSSEIH